MNSYYQIETPLTLHADPVNPLHAVTKEYVDAKAMNIEGSRFLTGTIAIIKLPALVGDVSSVKGTNVVTLSNSGVAAGVYNSVTVDAKGRITAGTYTASNESNLSWGIVQSTPTTLAGYGIVDVVSTTESETLASVLVTSDPVGTSTELVKKVTADAMVVAAATPSALNTGSVVISSSVQSPPGMLRANGGILSKVTYAALYTVLGEYFSYNTTQFKLPDFTGQEAGGLFYYIKY